MAVRLRRDGTLEVGPYFWDQDGPVTMVGPIRHPAIHSGDKDNTVLVIWRGGQTLEIYVNGQAICQPIQLKERLASVCPGVGLGERCGAPRLKGRVEFSRFMVWRLPAQNKP